jgi:hypothetical protein
MLAQRVLKINYMAKIPRINRLVRAPIKTDQVIKVINQKEVYYSTLIYVTLSDLYP